MCVVVFFFYCYGDHRDLHRVDRRQRQMCIRDRFEAVNGLPNEQRDCVLMRFIQGLSIAQTAAALGRSEGAVKQLQLRAVRSLAKTVSEDVR